MLRKLIWNFICKSDILVARVFKAKYYPDNHILTTTRQGDSVLGDGRIINACTDPWLTRKTDFKVENNEFG